MDINLDHDPSILTGRGARDELQSASAWFVAPNTQHLSEFTTISMQVSNYNSTTPIGRRGQVAITIRDTPPPPIANPQLYNYQGILYLIYAGALIVMFPSLTQLAQLKFQNNKRSPFETHKFFVNTAVVAYTIAIPTSVALFSMKAHLANSTRQHFSLINYIYVFLKTVFSFSGILAPLSLVLVLLFPNGFNWIGYSIIFMLFVVIVAFNFNDYRKLICKKDVSNLGVVQRDELSSHSTMTIGEI